MAVVVITLFTFESETIATFVSPVELTVGVVSVLVVVVVVAFFGVDSNANFVAYAVA